MLEDLAALLATRTNSRTHETGTTNFVCTNQAFPEFHPNFLHIAGKARIQVDLRQYLWNKLSLKLRKNLLPSFTTLAIVKTLTDQRAFFDKQCKRVKREEGLIQVRATARAASPPLVLRLVELRVFPAPKPYVHTLAVTDNPEPFKCYNCSKEGHGSRECPEPLRAVMHEVDEVEEYKDEELEYGDESGKQEA